MTHSAWSDSAPSERGGSLVARLRLEHLWVVTPILAAVWMALLNPLRSLDFWWHLQVGEVILASRSIPSVDWFSYTRAGTPFVYQNWLGEVLYAIAYHAGGFPLLIFFNAALIGVAILCVVRLCHESHVGWRPATLAALPSAVVLGFYSNVRPQVYSFALFTAFYWILWGFRERRRDHLWVLPLLMAVWTNLHGAFVLGIGLICLILATETLRWLRSGPHGTGLAPAALRKLALILVLVVLASMVNPQGYRVYAYVRQLQVDPASQQLVAEWQAPDIKQLSGLLFFFIPFFLSLLACMYSERRLDLTELGLYLGFGALGLSGMRNAIWFALILAPLLARQLAAVDVAALLGDGRAGFRSSALWRRLTAGAARPSVRRPRLTWALLLALLFFTVLVSPWLRPILRSTPTRVALVESGTPVGAMDYIAAHGLTGHIFHPQSCGDYLIWRLWPQQHSFIDGRVHLYDMPFVRDYVLVFHDDRWEARLDKYDVQYLLLRKEDPTCASLIRDARSQGKWTLLYEDDGWVFFEKGVSPRTGAGMDGVSSSGESVARKAEWTDWRL
jgi:hypothetical protein